MGEKEWSCHFIEQCGNGLLPNRTLGYFGTLGYQGDVKLKNKFLARSQKPEEDDEIERRTVHFLSRRSSWKG
jgi:hypothetical protein